MKIRNEWHVKDETLNDRFHDKDIELQSVIDNFNFRRKYSNESKELVINGIKEWCIVQTSSNPLKELEDQRKICCPANMDVNRGDYVEYDNELWLITTNVINIDGAYKMTRMAMCNLELFWQDDSGNIVSKNAFIQNASAYNSGEEGYKTLTLQYNQFMVNIPCDDDTLKLTDGKRIHMSKRTSICMPYRLTRFDDVTYGYSKKGVINIIFTQSQYNSEKDKMIDLPNGKKIWICDYFSPTPPSSQSSEASNKSPILLGKILYRGKKEITSGGNTKTLSAEITNSNGQITSTIPFTWNVTIDDRFKDYLHLEITTDNKCKIKLDYDNLLPGNYINVSLLDENNNKIAFEQFDIGGGS